MADRNASGKDDHEAGPDLPAQMNQIQSLVSTDGTLSVSVAAVNRPEPKTDQVLVKVMAAPINPSDLSNLLAGADLSTVRPGSGLAFEADIPVAAAPALAGRFDQPLPMGNEGAGVVVAAGSSEPAQRLVGRTVAVLGGAMYSQYRVVGVNDTLVLPEGTDPRQAASMFVNPLTALGMIETMRRDGHQALVHTAAASNLGQMLNRICLADEIDLVNIVRSPAQVALLRSIGANWVVDSSQPSFFDDLVTAVATTSATIAFDAIGGGTMASTILSAMERAASAKADGTYNRYGSTTHKQVFIYGGLDRGPTELGRSFGMAWGVGGWLLPNFLAAARPEVGTKLRRRVVKEMETTFASAYAQEISLAQMVDPTVVETYAAMKTGEKFLILPNGTPSACDAG